MLYGYLSCLHWPHFFCLCLQRRQGRGARILTHHNTVLTVQVTKKRYLRYHRATLEEPTVTCDTISENIWGRRYKSSPRSINQTSKNDFLYLSSDYSWKQEAVKARERFYLRLRWKGRTLNKAMVSSSFSRLWESLAQTTLSVVQTKIKWGSSHARSATMTDHRSNLEKCQVCILSHEIFITWGGESKISLSIFHHSTWTRLY